MLNQLLNPQISSCVYTSLSSERGNNVCNPVCADLKRELIRVNIIIETDEDDLLGVSDFKDAKPFQFNA